MSSAAETPFVVKICGITSEEDAAMATSAGANAIGFNFYPASPRYITPARAREIAEAISGPCLKVGVFVNPNEEELSTVVKEAELDVVQLHGENCPKQVPTSCRVWRSLTAERFQAADGLNAEAYLLDAFSSQFGGSGKTFDWSLATDFPYRKIIAGGLDATNVAEAIRKTLPWGVDACSRLESSAGKKDRRRVCDFIRAAQVAFTSYSRVREEIAP